jgi:hypothetical protein
MKLKGLALTLPVCDLRPFYAPESRRKSISPYVATVGETHIIGFGAAEERKLNIPWRHQDTIFFNCAGAISLPDYMPDGESVDRAVRRVYVDSQALVRFEFIIFGPPKHHYAEYRRRADEFARDFWESRVTIIQRGSKTEETFATAIPKLVNKFTAMTTPAFNTDPIRAEFVQVLRPQVQVIAEVSLEERNILNPEHSSDEERISLAFRSLKMKGTPAVVDTIYITYPVGSFTRPGRPEYLPLSHARAHTAWLHADLEIFTYILKRCIHNEMDQALVSDYLVTLANRLRLAPRLGHTEQQILFELVGAMEKFHENRLSRLLAGLRSSSLPDGFKNRVDVLISSYLSGVEPEDNDIDIVSDFLPAPKSFLPTRSDWPTPQQREEVRDATQVIAAPELIDVLSLSKTLEGIAEGQEAANEYHDFILGALEIIFAPVLRNPIKEQEIHEGRKRIDVVFYNASERGFFYDLILKHRIKCPFVFFECKNYSSDPANRELDQLAGRFSKERGKVGVLVCRRVKDRKLMLQRRKDAVHDSRGYILVLDDTDITNLLHLAADRVPKGVDDYMHNLFRPLVM